MRSRRDDNTEATVAALLRAGRNRFAKQGFEAAAVEQIADDARVTTGAIYHHFKGKKGLLQAVAEQIEVELLARAAAVEDADPWRRLCKAFEVLIDACAAPDVQRITFLDAPRVLGQQAWREIELRYAYGGMASALEDLNAAGVVRPYSVELVAPMLLAVLMEASRAVAANPATRTEAIELMLCVLEALRAPERQVRR